MAMRYLGGGVGHQATRDTVPIVQADEDLEAIDDGVVAAVDLVSVDRDEILHMAGDDREGDGVASEHSDDEGDTSAGEDEGLEGSGEDFFDPEDGEGAEEGLLALEGYGDL